MRVGHTHALRETRAAIKRERIMRSLVRGWLSLPQKISSSGSNALRCDGAVMPLGGALEPLAVGVVDLVVAAPTASVSAGVTSLAANSGDAECGELLVASGRAAFGC